MPSGIYTLTLFRGIAFESLCYVYPSVPWSSSGGRPCCTRYMHRCNKKVTPAARLSSSCSSLSTCSLCDQVSRRCLRWPEPGGFLPPHAVTAESRPPSIPRPELQGAALQREGGGRWGEEGNGDGWFITSLAATVLLAQAAPFLSMETQLARQRWLLPQLLTLWFKDALVGVACTEKQLLWEWFFITDGKRKGKYLCVINAIRKWSAV